MEERPDRPRPTLAPVLPPPPAQTQTERAAWVVYGVVAVVLVLVPTLSHSLSPVDIGCWVLLLGAAAISFYWHRSGSLIAPEWLTPDDYEEFLADIQQEVIEAPAPPTQPARLESPKPSADRPPGR